MCLDRELSRSIDKGATARTATGLRTCAAKWLLDFSGENTCDEIELPTRDDVSPGPKGVAVTQVGSGEVESGIDLVEVTGSARPPCCERGTHIGFASKSSSVESIGTMTLLFSYTSDFADAAAFTAVDEVKCTRVGLDSLIGDALQKVKATEAGTDTRGNPERRVAGGDVTTDERDAVATELNAADSICTGGVWVQSCDRRKKCTDA
jgi:hypothetical protein